MDSTLGTDVIIMEDVAEDHSLIDLDTKIDLKCNSIPLVPLPQSDSPLGKELLNGGDNPFDNAALEATCSENDPFEFLSLKAIRRSKEFSSKESTPEVSVECVSNYSFLGTEQHDYTNIDKTSETNNGRSMNYKLVENVDLLSHLKSSSKNNIISSAINPSPSGDDKRNLLDSSPSQFHPQDCVPLENQDGSYLKFNNCVESLESISAPFPCISQELSPATFVKTRIRKCIAEAKKNIPTAIHKKIDFASLASPYNRRRSLDSLKRDTIKSSPYARQKKYRKSLDMPQGDYEISVNENYKQKHFPLGYGFREKCDTRSKEYNSENTTSNSTILFQKYLESNNRNTIPGFSSLKNQGKRNSPIYRSPKEQQELELHFASKFHNLEATSMQDKLLSDESIIEFSELESDEETNIQNKQYAVSKSKNQEVIQHNAEAKKGIRSSPTPRQNQITEKEQNWQTPHSKSTQDKNGKSFQKLTETPKSGGAYAVKNTLQRMNSAGRIETRKTAQLIKKNVQKTLRSKSDGSMCNKSYKQMNQSPSPVSLLSKELLPSTSNTPTTRFLQKRHSGRITKPLKSLGKVLQKF